MFEKFMTFVGKTISVIFGIVGLIVAISALGWLLYALFDVLFG